MLTFLVLKHDNMLNLVDELWDLIMGDETPRLLYFHLFDHFKLLSRY
jgi:hypothetical protein